MISNVDELSMKIGIGIIGDAPAATHIHLAYWPIVPPKSSAIISDSVEL